MENAQRKETIQNEENQQYYELEITPALEKYLLDVDEGREELLGPYKDAEDLTRSVLGDDWRQHNPNVSSVPK